MHHKPQFLHSFMNPFKNRGGINIVIKSAHHHLKGASEMMVFPLATVAALASDMIVNIEIGGRKLVSLHNFEQC